MRLHDVFIIFISITLFEVNTILALVDDKNYHFEARSNLVSSNNDGGDESKSDIESTHPSSLVPANNNSDTKNILPSFSLNQLEFQKRSFSSRHGGRFNGLGYDCQGTFHSKSKLDALANKACDEPIGLIKGKMHKIFRVPLKQYQGPAIFFKGHEDLKMQRILPRFFSSVRFARFLRFGKKDYQVFAGRCRPVGVVRINPKGVYYNFSYEVL